MDSVFAVTNNDTGEIVRFVKVQNESTYVEQAEPGFTSIELTGVEIDPTVWNSDLYMMDGQTLVMRPKLFPETELTVEADGETTIQMGLPEGTEIFHQMEHFVSDSSFEFCTAAPGEYEFRVRPPFPYQPQTIRITAT